LILIYKYFGFLFNIRKNGSITENIKNPNHLFTLMTPKEKLALIKRNTQEIVTEEELLKLLKEKKKPSAYIGYAPTGKMHIGHFVPIMKIADFLKAGFKVKFLVADMHAFLDDMKSPWELLKLRTDYYAEAVKGMVQAIGVKTENLEFIQGSKYQLKEDYMLDTLHLAGEVTMNRAKRAAAEVVRFKDDPKLGGFIYPLMEILDPIYLDVDVCFGGIDQRGIYMLGREVIPKLKGRTLTCVFTPLLPGLKGAKMSASDASSKIDVLDSPEDVKKKMAKAFCPAGEVKDNGVLAFTKYVVFTILQDKKKNFIIKRPEKFGGNKEYKTYEALEKDYVSGALHPMDLKTGLAEEINTLLEPVRKRFTNKKDLVKKAYPE